MFYVLEGYFLQWCTVQPAIQILAAEAGHDLINFNNSQLILFMPAHPRHRAVQCGDQGAVEQAIHHAWAALDAGAHKQLGDGSRPAVPLFLRRFDAGEGGSAGCGATSIAGSQLGWGRCALKMAASLDLENPACDGLALACWHALSAAGRPPLTATGTGRACIYGSHRFHGSPSCLPALQAGCTA